MKLILFFSLYLLANLTLCAEDCHKQLQNVISCLNKKHADNKAADDAKIEAMKKAIGKCFTDNSCDPPDFDGQKGDTMKEQWDKQPDAVKQCIRNDMKKGATDKINDCLAKQNVQKLQDNEIDDYDLFDDNSSPSQSEQIRKYVRMTFQAFGKCRQDHPDKAQAVGICIKPIKDAAKPEVCKRLGDCIVQVKVSDSCVKRGKDIKGALCKCRQDRMQEQKKKIEQLQQKGGDVDANEIKDTRESDHAMGNYDPDVIEKCYKDKGNGAKPPPFVSVLKMKQNHQGESKSLMSVFKQTQNRKVTQAQLQQMHDRLEERTKNQDCGC